MQIYFLKTFSGIDLYEYNMLSNKKQHIKKKKEAYHPGPSWNCNPKRGLSRPPIAVASSF